MQIPVAEQTKKTVRIIAPTINPQETAKSKYRQLRVVAYCRVSTKQEEQLNSYETQKNYYTERINAEPDWTLVAIFADKGITGTSVDTFDEQRVKELMDEKSKLQQQLAQIAERKQKRENTKSRLDEIFTILDGIKNRPMEYDDRLVRQIIECVVVESKERIKVVFVGGLEITENLINNI